MTEVPGPILGLESSCDETAAAILAADGRVLAQFVASQIDLHREYGGVVPEIACRAHMECLLPGLKRLFDEAGVTPAELAAVAVTNRPGLIGALLVGVTAAKSLSLAWNKPLIGVSHLEAHIAACTYSHPEMTFPFVALVVSGGHTNVYNLPAEGVYELWGATRDDAAGEAFDKVAKILDLGFPGGPVVQKAAEKGNPKAFPWRDTCLTEDERTLSFSGLKTAVLYAARGQKAGRKGPLLLDTQGVADAAASFQAAVVHALVRRTCAAARQLGVKWIALGGGVAANKPLREELTRAAQAEGRQVAIAPMSLCTDNAVMVAAARGVRRPEPGSAGAADLIAAKRGNFFAEKFPPTPSKNSQPASPFRAFGG